MSKFLRGLVGTILVAVHPNGDDWRIRQRANPERSREPITSNGLRRNCSHL